MKEDCFSGPRFGYLDGWWVHLPVAWVVWRSRWMCWRWQEIGPRKKAWRTFWEDCEELEVEPREMPAIRCRRRQTNLLSNVPLKKQNSQGSRGCQGKRCRTVFTYREIKACSWKEGQIQESKLMWEWKAGATKQGVKEWLEEEEVKAILCEKLGDKRDRKESTKNMDNSSYHLLNTHYVPGTVLRASCVLSCFTPLHLQSGRCYCLPHSTPDETETESQHHTAGTQSQAHQAVWPQKLLVSWELVCQ